MITILLSAMFVTAGITAADTVQLRVMTFNVRYATAPDGDNGWEHRRELLIETVRKFDPDVLGLQEALADQLDEIAAQLPTHTVIGVGRDDGKRKGEFSALLIRTDRFEIVDSGTFWLSETPNLIASKSWDAALCRIATHATVRDRKADEHIFLLNTHWDHQGEIARIESAKLVAQSIEAALQKKHFVIVTGDLNCTQESKGYQILSRSLRDVYRAANPEKRRDEATFHNFRGNTPGDAIDFIFASRDLRVRGATIDRTQREGRYPSDHFPVTAELLLPLKRD